MSGCIGLSMVYIHFGPVPLRSLSTSVLLLSRTEVDVQFGPLSLRSFVSSVLSTDLDIHFGPYKATSVLLLLCERSAIRQLFGSRLHALICGHRLNLIVDSLIAYSRLLGQFHVPIVRPTLNGNLA